MSKLTHIKQRESHDCGIAAIAMLVDSMYEEVQSVALGVGIDVQQQQGMCDLQAKYLFMQFEFFTEDFYNTTCSSVGWRAGRYLAVVPSLNLVGKSHYIALDLTEDGGVRVLDPKYGVGNAKALAPDTPFEQVVVSRAMRVMDYW